MGDYYIYEGRLYSSDQLMHFRLGWTKPNHKWIKREKKNGKWVYTYNRNEQRKQNNLAVMETVTSAKADSDNVVLGAELQQLLKETGRANAKPDAAKQKRIQEIRSQMAKNRQRARLAASKAESAKRKSVSMQRNIQKDEGYQQAISNQRVKNNINKAKKFVASGGLIETLKHPLDKKKREEAVKKAEQKYVEKNRTKDPSLYKTAQIANEGVARKYEQSTQRSKVAKATNSARIKLLKTGTNSKTNVAKTNPGYEKMYLKAMQTGEVDPKEYQKYGQNCSNCALAYDLRTKGYDVEANPNTDDYLMDATVTKGTKASDVVSQFNSNYISGDEIKELITMYDGTPKHSSFEGTKTQQKIRSTTADPVEQNKMIEQEMLKGGNGSHGIITVMWKGYDSGHALSYEVQNNKVMIIDAQNGETYPMSELYDNTEDVQFVQTDGLTPNGDVFRKVKKSGT